MEHRATIPILRSFDEAKAREFYCDFLGFTVDWEHRFEPGLPLFMQMSLGTIRIFVSEHHGDATPGSHICFSVKGLRGYHAAIMAKGYPNARPGIEPHHSGGIQVVIPDPFGNRIEFFEEGAG